MPNASVIFAALQIARLLADLGQGHLSAAVALLTRSRL